MCERQKRRGTHSFFDAVLFFPEGKKNFSIPFFSAPPKLPLLSFQMTRSHAPASAALLACSLLLCAASSAQVREKFFFRRCFFSSASRQHRDSIATASRHRFWQSSKHHCFLFPASRVRRRALIVSFVDVSRRSVAQAVAVTRPPPPLHLLAIAIPLLPSPMHFLALAPLLPLSNFFLLCFLRFAFSCLFSPLTKIERNQLHHLKKKTGLQRPFPQRPPHEHDRKAAF